MITNKASLMVHIVMNQCCPNGNLKCQQSPSKWLHPMSGDCIDSPVSTVTLARTASREPMKNGCQWWTNAPMLASEWFQRMVIQQSRKKGTH